MLNSSSDDIDYTAKSDVKYDSERDCNLHIHMENYVDAPDGVDSDYAMDMKSDGDDEEEEDEEEEDEEEKDEEEEDVEEEDEEEEDEEEEGEEEEEEEEEDENEEEDKDEDDGKEPRTIGQGEMVNSLADDVDDMSDNQPIMLPEQGHGMREDTLWPHPLAPAPLRHSPEPRPRPWTPETHPLGGLDHLALVTPQKPRWAVPTVREDETSRTSSDVDVDQQLVDETADANNLPDVRLTDAPPSEARMDGCIGEEGTSPRSTEEPMVVVFGLGSGYCLVCFHCSNLCISGIDYYTCHQVFGSLRVYLIHGLCIGFILFIVL